MTARQNQGPVWTLPRGAHVESNGRVQVACYCLMGRNHSIDERES